MIVKNPEEYTVDELESVKCPAEEQETTIVAYRTDAEWDLYTSDNTMLTKVKKFMREHPDCCRLTKVVWETKGVPAGYEFAIAKRSVSFRGKTEKNMSEEQKAAAAERFKAYRESKKNKKEEE